MESQKENIESQKACASCVNSRVAKENCEERLEVEVSWGAGQVIYPLVGELRCPGTRYGRKSLPKDDGRSGQNSRIKYLELDYLEGK